MKQSVKEKEGMERRCKRGGSSLEGTDWAKEKKGQIWIGEILGGTGEELGRTEKRLGIRMKD